MNIKYERRLVIMTKKLELTYGEKEAEMKTRKTSGIRSCLQKATHVAIKKKRVSWQNLFAILK